MYKTNEKSFKIEHYKTSLRPSFGCSVAEAHYTITHINYGIKNIYDLTAQVRGFESGQVYLTAESVTCTNEPNSHEPETNCNDETLSDDAIKELFEDEVN